MKKTIGNKILSSIFILVGAGSIFIDGDSTVFIITLMFGLPLFFAKKNWIS